MASAASSVMPAPVSPTVKPNSVTPMPPGTGMKVANSDTLRLITRRSASEMCEPRPRAIRPSAVANSTSVARFPPITIANLCEPRSDASVARTSGHHFRTRLEIILRSLPTQVNVRMLTTSSPTNTNASFLAPSVGTSKSTCTSDCEKISSSTNNTA